MISTNELKNGITLDIDGVLWTVTSFQHVNPGKGAAFVRTKLKNVSNGKVVDRTFNAGVKVNQAVIDRRDKQYLYQDGDNYVFMDLDTFDQLEIPEETVGDARHYLLPGSTASVAVHDDVPIYVELPASVVLEISDTAPGLQGDRSTGGTKPATVETGLEIAVPLFLQIGDKVKVDTRSGDYLGRVS